MKAEAVQPDKEGGYWQVVEKRIDFLEGAQFAACLFSSLSKKRPPIHSYRKSEQHTDRYFPTVCMLFFCCIDFSVGRLFPLPSAFLVQT